MKAVRSMPAQTNPYLYRFQTSPDAPSYSGPGRFHPIYRQVFPHGFGQIHHKSNTVTWAEVKTLIHPNGIYEAIFSGLRYDIINTVVSDNRCQTELQMISHSPEGKLLETLILIYQFPHGRWDLADLVQCKIIQPEYKKAKAGCILFQSLQSPIQSCDVDVYLRQLKSIMISFGGELYFISYRSRTVKKVIRNENNAREYDELLTEIGDYSTKKPSKTELNQGYFSQSYQQDASRLVCNKISLLTGCSLEESALDDGEGLIYENGANESRLLMGYVDAFPKPGRIPPRDYTMFWGNQDNRYFYKGSGFLVDDSRILLNGHGIYGARRNREWGREVILHQGQYEMNLKSGPGTEFIYEVTNMGHEDSLSLRRARSCSLYRGSWKEDRKDGEFSIAASDNIKSYGVLFCANQRTPRPFVYEQGDAVNIVIYAEGATAEQMSFCLTLLKTYAETPRFSKLIASSPIDREYFELIPFFNEIRTCPNVDRFWMLLFKYASFADLCVFNLLSIIGGDRDLATQFFTRSCGPFPLPERSNLPEFAISDLSAQALLSYLDITLLYLSSLSSNSKLYRCASLLKLFYSDPMFQDYAAVLSYFDELEPIWGNILSERKSMRPQEKRKVLESLLLESALPWIFKRIYMLYSPILTYKISQLEEFTQVEMAVAELFNSLNNVSRMASVKRSCDVLDALEHSSREELITHESRCFKHFLDTALLSKAYVTAREELYLDTWHQLFDDFRKQVTRSREVIYEEQRQFQIAMRPVLKSLRLMMDFYGNESRRRDEIIGLEAFELDEMFQCVVRVFSQVQELYYAKESLQRRQLLELEHERFNALALLTTKEASDLKARLECLNIENSCRNEVQHDEIACFNQIKIHSHLAFVISCVSQLPFDRPFDVYIVGSAVANKVLGQDWRGGQDIDVMIVARAPGEFLQIREENTLRFGLRASPYIFGLYTWMTYVPGAGLRRLDLKVSDSPPNLNFLSRDFTVGALYATSTGQTLDPTQQGESDLRSKQLNTVQPAVMSFQNDPVRMFRAIKYFVNGFTLSQDIADAMRNWSGHLTEHQRNHICAVIRTHLGSLDNHAYINALNIHGLTRTVFGLSLSTSIEDTLRNLNRLVFPQSTQGLFRPPVEHPRSPYSWSRPTIGEV